MKQKYRWKLVLYYSASLLLYNDSLKSIYTYTKACIYLFLHLCYPTWSIYTNAFHITTDNFLKRSKRKYRKYEIKPNKIPFCASERGLSLIKMHEISESKHPRW